jgi:drug/metabolite transporter (DMT)-like permease
VIPSGAGKAADRTPTGIAFMIAGVLCFTVVDAAAKHVVSVVPVLVMIFLRQVMVMIMTIPIIWRSGGWRALRTTRPLEHLVRALTALVATFCFFYALRTVPLATAVSVAQAAPLLLTALSVPLLGERVGVWRWSAVALGLVGVLVIIQPGDGGAIQLDVLLVLFSALSFAVTMIMVRRLTSTENNLSLFFWANLLSLTASALPMPFVWVTPQPIELALIVLISVAMLAAQWLTVEAFRLAPVGAIAPFQYLEIAGGAWFGWLFWREAVALNVWIGAAIVVASGLVVIWRERVRTRQP